MTGLSSRLLFWAPRVFAVAYIGFLSLFALDVFGEGHGIARTLIALAMHLAPSVVMVGFLALAWRRDWLGAVLFGAAGLYYLHLGLPRHVPTAMKLVWILTIAGPAFAIAVLFLASWLRLEMRGAARSAGKGP
jgi:hypothetical protein